MCVPLVYLYFVTSDDDDSFLEISTCWKRCNCDIFVMLNNRFLFTIFKVYSVVEKLVLI